MRWISKRSRRAEVRSLASWIVVKSFGADNGDEVMDIWSNLNTAGGQDNRPC